jgi:hypothetical protein
MNAYQILNVNKADDLRAIKGAFHKLALENHPDRGGDSEMMKKLNEAWEWMRENHGAYTKEEREHVKYDVDEELINLAVEVLNKNGNINVVIAGAWIWVEGDKIHFTADFRNYLKKQKGFRYAPKKKAWYFAGCRTSSRGQYNLNEIYAHYGRYDVRQTENNQMLKAAC